MAERTIQVSREYDRTIQVFREYDHEGTGLVSRPSLVKVLHGQMLGDTEIVQSLVGFEAACKHSNPGGLQRDGVPYEPFVKWLCDGEPSEGISNVFFELNGLSPATALRDFLTSSGKERLLLISCQLDSNLKLGNAALETVAVVYFHPQCLSLADLEGQLIAAGDIQLHSVAVATHGPTEDGIWPICQANLCLDSPTEGVDDLLPLLAALGGLVGSQGHVDLLACNLASTPGGRAAIQTMESQTGKHFCASTDETGNVELGGNWELETHDRNVAPIYFHCSRLHIFKQLMKRRKQNKTEIRAAQLKENQKQRDAMDDAKTQLAELSGTYISNLLKGFEDAFENGDPVDKATFETIHNKAVREAKIAVLTLFGEKASEAVIEKLAITWLTSSLARSIEGKVAVETTRLVSKRGAVVMGGVATKVATGFLGTSGAGAAAAVLRASNPAMLAAFVGECVGVYVIGPYFFPNASEELVGFIGAVFAGAAVGGTLGLIGTAGVCAVPGAIGGALAGATSWGLGQVCEAALGAAMQNEDGDYTIQAGIKDIGKGSGLKHQLSNGVLMMEPYDICNEKWWVGWQAWENVYKRTFTIPEGTLLTYIALVDRWHDGSNGIATITVKTPPGTEKVWRPAYSGPQGAYEAAGWYTKTVPGKVTLTCTSDPGGNVNQGSLAVGPCTVIVGIHGDAFRSNHWDLHLQALTFRGEGGVTSVVPWYD